MKVLVIGSGGREHALVWKLAQSPHVTRLWCAPGNPGVSQERLVKNGLCAERVAIGAEELEKLANHAARERIDLTVVGPDNPLALGVVDLFAARGLRIWGPSQEAARFESSKVFSQEFMARHGIPTPQAESFDDPSSAKQCAAGFKGRCAVKADGLALGKGVFICHSEAEASRAIDELMVRRAFSTAGSRVVIQELIEGPEVSIHALCDGKTALLLETAQDHKRAFEGDLGPNTGGMGAYSPVPFVTELERQEIQERIIQPWLEGCQAEGIQFRGVLFPGLMWTARGPQVLEFNARFGDPETQALLARLESDLIELIEASLNGALDQRRLVWRPGASVCVVMASGGYPGTFAKGKAIDGLDQAARLENVKIFHAGTAENDGRMVTAGGRVLGVTAWGADVARARARAYEAVETIHFEDAHFRRDIGLRALQA